MVPAVSEKLGEMKDRKSVVLYGSEAHVCIRQTAFDLIERGYEVHFLINDHQISQEILKNHGYELNTVDLLDFQSDWESEFIHEFELLITNSASRYGP